IEVVRSHQASGQVAPRRRIGRRRNLVRSTPGGKRRFRRPWKAGVLEDTVRGVSTLGTGNDDDMRLVGMSPLRMAALCVADPAPTGGVQKSGQLRIKVLRHGAARSGTDPALAHEDGLKPKWASSGDDVETA